MPPSASTTTTGRRPRASARSISGPARERKGQQGQQDAEQASLPTTTSGDLLLTTGRSFPAPTPWSETMAVENMRLAQNRASRMALRTKMPIEDLRAVAFAGLLKACRRYDPERINPATGRPYRLSSCAVPFIDGALRQWLRDHGHPFTLPNRWRELGPQVRRLAGEGKTLAQIEEATGMPAGEVEELLEATSATATLEAVPTGAMSTGTGAPVEGEDPGSDGAGSATDPWESPELQDLLAITVRAWPLLQWHDQRLLSAAWAGRRREVATQALGQFRRAARRIAGPGLCVGGRERVALGFEVPMDGPGSSARSARAAHIRISDRQKEVAEAEKAAEALSERAEQLGLFVVGDAAA